jgi:geranylgeranyl diphosphate synthase type 3
MKTRNSFADDITEGKFSFPITHAILFGNQSARLLEILKLRTTDISLKQEAIQIIKDSGSFQYTLNELKKYADQISALIANLGGNARLEKAIQHLSEL